MRTWSRLLLLLLVVSVVLLRSEAGLRLSTTIVRRYRAIAARPWLSVCVVATIALLHCVWFAELRTPAPFVPDEFSKLLAAETFASGRLTNPTHPMWPYLDSLHVLQGPTRQSKYPPADALLMGLGQAVRGEPLVGVWLGLAIACGVLVWMLRAWVGPSWAFGGGLLAASHGRLVSDFGMTYIGGSLAMLGGALVLGSLRRVIDDPQTKHAVPLAVGVAVLANTRPFEGLIMCLPVAVLMLVWRMREKRLPGRALDTRVVLPIVSILVVTGLLMGAYHFAVMGTPFSVPYLVYQAGGTEAQFVLSSRSGVAAGIMVEHFGNLMQGLRLTDPLFFMAVLLLPLGRMVRQRWIAFATLTFVVTLLAVCLTLGAAGRYLAPVYPLFFLLVIQSIRHMRIVVRRRAFLRVAFAGSLMLGWGTLLHDGAIAHAGPPVRSEWTRERAELVDPLEQDAERHLVLVRPAPGEPFQRQWVYNPAEIDAAKVVWAYDERIPLTPLLQYFEDRRHWLLDMGRRPLTLTELPAEDETSWSLNQHNGAIARLERPENVPGAFRVEIEQGGTELWHVEVHTYHPPIRRGVEYAVRFRARADGQRRVRVRVAQAHPPWVGLGLSRQIDLTREWQDFEFSFTATQDDGLVRMGFHLGGDTVAVDVLPEPTAPP